MAPVSDVTRFICLFHNADRAKKVAEALQQAGISPDAITMMGSGDAPRSSNALSDLGAPARDVDHLQEGLRQGGVIVSLLAPESQTKTIEGIFHRYSADKVDETETGTSLPAAAATEAVVPMAAAAYSSDTVVDQAVIPVAEESLVVGKREVDRGGVRVFRRTVEEPVQQDVSLHSERVALEYREVNRPVTDADLRAGNQEIELVETAEVPVVEKVARVVEEVRVGKVESDRTEVVSDTVRHTEVEVQPVETTESRTRVN